MADIPQLTWPMLLAKWTEFAQASAAFPLSGEGGRWRQGVPAIIGLQAVACALGDSDRLERSERALAQDRGEVLVRQYAAQLGAIWHGEPMPERLLELMDDARAALRLARGRGVEWVAGEGGYTAGRAMSMEGAWGGEVVVLAEGERVEAGMPVAFARGEFGGPPEEGVLAAIGAWLAAGEGEVAGPRGVAGARQVYRQPEGGPDLVLPLEDGLPAGRPLLRAVGGA